MVFLVAIQNPVLELFQFQIREIIPRQEVMAEFICRLMPQSILFNIQAIITKRKMLIFKWPRIKDWAHVQDVWTLITLGPIAQKKSSATNADSGATSPETVAPYSTPARRYQRRQP